MTHHADYDAIKAMNWSTLRNMAESPLKFKHRLTTPREDTQALFLGRALHCCVLEPERWAREYVAEPKHGDMRTTKAKEAKAAWMSDLGNRTPIPVDDYQAIVCAADAVHSHRVARELLSGGRAEEIITWTDPETELACKARLDYVTPLGIRELKSARSVGGRWSRDAAGYLYHGQAAYYHDGGMLSGAISHGAFLPCVVSVELEAPFDVACDEMIPETYAAGVVLYRSCLRRLVECTAADVWPGVAPDLREWRLPRWAAGMGDEEGEG